jgi:hypothetical protein
MFIRTRDWLARALTPAFLLSLAALWASFSGDSSDWGCELYKMKHWRQYKAWIDIRAGEELDWMVSRAAGVFAAAWREQAYLFSFLSAFALAYLLLARERLSIRVVVVAGVLFLTLVLPNFRPLC